MTKFELLGFLRSHKLAVVASVSASGAPQAAVVGIVVSDDFELFFDTLSTSRKYHNLAVDPRVACVIGWDLDRARTVQLEGIADEPDGAELGRLLRLYLQAFPDGEERRNWPNIAYLRIRPHFIRFSDFSGGNPSIVEFDAASLRSEAAEPR
jgi:hypothetical protein